jgi:hypothetical protein
MNRRLWQLGFALAAFAPASAWAEDMPAEPSEEKLQ